MLTLNNIVKDYSMGDEVVHALRGVSVKFRPHEFVAILGPSGCGKTTLLNIIGGLDHYTDGDLIISGTSTKEYKDRDWDSYRNHRVGFVFQSYNLIPHQTVLANVELALTLSGVSRAERHARAAAALENVGLGEQLKKKPNQMSGGQMQRVAIARALVNDPDIVLADEPTGALDTATSVQIMEILRSISDKKLIVMVTHNPELAEEYATRIIRVVDGQVVEDTNPYDGEENDVQASVTGDMHDRIDFSYLKTSDLRGALIASVDPTAADREDLINAYKHGDRESLIAVAKSKKLCVDKLSEPARARYMRAKEGNIPEGKAGKTKKARTSMSFLTALSLSLNNLMTKKARTFLTSFAGSIGIIGIALILSLANGIKIFIDRVQEDTLSTYPLQVYEQTQDFSAMLGAMSEVGSISEEEKEAYRNSGKIYVDDSMGTMMSALNKVQNNNLEAFKAHIDENYDSIKDYLSAIQYTYHFDLQVFSSDGKTQVNPTTIFDNMGDSFSGVSDLMNASGMKISAMSEMIDNPALLEEQYTLLEGSWPKERDELVLVISENNQISKMTLYMLGVLDQSEIAEIIEAMMSGKELETEPIEPFEFSDFIGKEFYLVNTSDFYEEAEGREGYTVDGVTYPVWQDVRKDPFYDQASYVTDPNNGLKLKITGIIRPSDEATAASISTNLAYTKALTDYILEKNDESKILKQQKETKDYNVTTGLKFERTVYTPENIDRLIATIDQSTLEMVYVYMNKMLPSFFANPENPPVNADTFDDCMKAMNSEQLAEFIGMMCGYAAQNDPAGLVALCTALSEGDTVTATPENLARVYPILSAEKQVTARDTLKTLCGETNMQGIYAILNQALAGMTVNADNFMQFIKLIGDNEALFGMLEQTLYDMAPQTDATLETVLKELGDSSAAKPASISFYAVDFKAKDKIAQFIADYNAECEASEDEEIKNNKIEYTDLVGMLMSSISTILDVITYVLIAFVSISLVVSSIMIGIITYISVLERIKEIGILRAIGASKRNISQVFLAETLIIGFISGMLGIITTLLLCIPINLVIGSFTTLAVSAQLPFVGAVVLVAISMLLTLIAGVIPAKIAAKKEPVDALRSE